jgi:hypothetical protein
MNNTSKTNLQKIDALTEEEIDTSDIPPLTEEFFSKLRWWKPVERFKPISRQTLKFIEGITQD